MPNQPVPAAAEGLPTAFIKENRILELAREISELLDEVPGKDFVTVFAASRGPGHRILLGRMEGDESKPTVCTRSMSTLSHIIEAQCKVSDLQEMSRLMTMALASIATDDDIRALLGASHTIERKLLEVASLIEDSEVPKS